MHQVKPSLAMLGEAQLHKAIQRIEEYDEPMNSFDNDAATRSNPLAASEPYRLFVGIALPPDVQRELELWAGSLQKALPFQKWTHPQDVHVTLSFLGDASAETALALAHDLRQVAAAAPCTSSW
ncbi:2'-5' RNA ligase family protein [Paenibacillus alba]|uniref:2'-5' RNA ligase family protein n=1 Tax=Paenibacillus alba TaxID=1197127 RepID=UPI00398B734C